MLGGTTRLFIRVATTANSNDGLESSANLPVNATTNVRLEAVGRELMLFFNNSFDAYTALSADRISGNATVYVSDPWHLPASANLAGIKMTEKKIITAIPPVSAVNGALKKGSGLEKTVVPADYALSFDITPLGVIHHWGSIIHYSGDELNYSPKGRMPGKMPDCLMNLTSSFLLLISHLVYSWNNQTSHSSCNHCQYE